jgi:hypothetical protein
MKTPNHPFVLPKNREAITGEPDGAGSRKTPLNPGIDWIGAAHRGGGKVPADLNWASSPKQWQEERGSGGRLNEVDAAKAPPSLTP